MDMSRKTLALFIVFVFLGSIVSLSAVSAADKDGDGVEDSSDNCPFAAGSSTVDRDGCLGTSKPDPFQKRTTQSREG